MHIIFEISCKLGSLLLKIETFKNIHASRVSANLGNLFKNNLYPAKLAKC